MKCCVEYTHPINGDTWYFCDLRDVDGVLKPVGCMGHRKRFATIFHKKRDAEILAKYLRSLGYRTHICDWR